MYQRRCNGAGICDIAESTCGNFNCASYNICDAACTAEDGSLADECISDVICSGGLCVSTKANGDPCMDWFECDSGNCVDEYCCSGACDGMCERCDVPDALGSCQDAVNNTDPDDDCPMCEACVSGACAPVPGGQDPMNDCAAGATGECAPTGECDGDGGCQLRGDDYLCGNKCNGDEIAPYYCDGTGLGRQACNVVGVVNDCPDNLACRELSDSCPTRCVAESDCVAGYYCDTTGACVTKKANGGACTRSSQCSDGFCVDGVCCNSACAGTRVRRATKPAQWARVRPMRPAPTRRTSVRRATPATQTPASLSTAPPHHKVIAPMPSNAAIPEYALLAAASSNRPDWPVAISSASMTRKGEMRR